MISYIVSYMVYTKEGSAGLPVVKGRFWMGSPISELLPPCLGSNRDTIGQVGCNRDRHTLYFASKFTLYLDPIYILGLFSFAV